jgi:hypothetical protein
MKRIRDNQLAGKHEAVRFYRSITPYFGGGGRWAIPAYIVLCESGYRWSVSYGPYSLIGVWAPRGPITNMHDKMLNHRAARDLWLTYGSSPWTCA